MKHPVFGCLSGLVLLAAHGFGFAREADCSVARDPRRCEAQQVAREACSGLQGQARSACMHEALPPPDCSRAPSTLQCQKRQAAAKACTDKRGKARTRCVREQLGND